MSTTRFQYGLRVPIALVGLSVIPVFAGTARLVQLSGGPEIIPADSRFTSSPIAVVMHVVCSIAYALFGAMQFAPGFRRRHPGWHRRAGRVLVVAGLGVAVSALWLTLFYPGKENSGDLLFILRLAFASGMVACLVLGVAAIRRRDVTTHRVWMIRAYALGLGAGTQAFTEGFGGALFGTSALALDASRGIAWVINLAVAEWAIRRPRRRSRRPAVARVLVGGQ
jgi:uncharacterized membrane protein